MDAKEVAARRAVEYVQDGMILGLGSGSTAAHAIRAIGERVRNEGLRIQGVPTSRRSRELALELDIPLVDLSDVGSIDLTIDGADEVNPELHLIKGGGGALVQEKIVACASRELVIICDDSKLHLSLGAFPLPVAALPFGWKTTRKRLQDYCGTVILRETTPGSGEPFRTDDGLYILDMHLGCIRDVAALEHNLKAIVGVAEVGLFVGLASRVVIGYADGRTEERTRPE